MKSVKVNVDKISTYDVPESLDGMIAALSEVRAKVPEEFRGAVRVDFDHGEYSSVVEFYYMRPQTPEEDAAEKDRHSAWLASRRESARRELARLEAELSQ
ncbi:hypothetical protein [Bosea sp. LjRoot237]|uniref:hypothetical protein n=1 Tax=Bosea sp. LjRoot237 TaxID=3342292 RepID=UPI003ECC38FD